MGKKRKNNRHLSNVECFHQSGHVGQAGFEITRRRRKCLNESLKNNSTKWNLNWKLNSHQMIFWVRRNETVLSLYSLSLNQYKVLLLSQRYFSPEFDKYLFYSSVGKAWEQNSLDKNLKFCGLCRQGFRWPKLRTKRE